MKSYGLVIDEELQPSRPFKQETSIQKQRGAFPLKSLVADNTQSYTTVVEQSIITQDKPLLKEIIVECSSEQLKNTIAAINITKISALLSLLEEFIYEDYKNTDSYCAWLKQLICRHIGVILSNSQNKIIVARLRKFIQKKVGERSALLQTKNTISLDAVAVESKKFTAKFSYVQSQQKEKPKEEEQGFMQDEDMGEDDLMMDDELDG